MDFGYPQTTETKILQEYITQESHKLEVQARPPIAVTNAVSWRSEGIRYRKNEVFLDVVESLNLLVSSTGNVLRSEILGAIKMKCYLSGMPELRLGLNDKAMFETTGRATRGKAVEMEDVKFHQCVRLSRFENDRTISFIPPDGEFELMSYRLNTQVKPLIWVESDVRNHSGSRIEFVLKARAQFKRRSTANNVEILVPVPSDADSPRFRTNIGSVHYAPEKSAIIWKIKQFGGGKEFLMRAELGLPSVKGDDEHGGGMTGGFGGSMGGVGGGKGKRPVQVKFEIPYFTTSGIQVRYLKIIEPKVRFFQHYYLLFCFSIAGHAGKNQGYLLFPSFIPLTFPFPYTANPDLNSPEIRVMCFFFFLDFEGSGNKAQPPRTGVVLQISVSARSGRLTTRRAAASTRVEATTRAHTRPPHHQHMVHLFLSLA